MASRLVQLRERATDDIENTVDYYFTEAGPAVASRFIDATERAINQISRSPGAGSPRLSFELGIPELRAHPVPRFPFLVFYVASDDVVDVWRVLHTSRDIPSALVDQSDG